MDIKTGDGFFDVLLDIADVSVASNRLTVIAVGVLDGTEYGYRVTMPAQMR